MSQKDAQEKTIAGHHFKVFKLPPLEAQDLLIDISHALAPALGKAVSAYDKLQGRDVMDLDVEDPRVSTAIATLVTGISKAKMRELVATLAKVTHADGKPLAPQLDELFRGDLELMYQWLWHALVTNFGSFTGWVGSALSVAKRTAGADPSPTTSGEPGP